MDFLSDGAESDPNPRPHKHPQSSSLSHVIDIPDEALVVVEGTFTATGPDIPESNAVIVAVDELESNPATLSEEHDDLLQLFDWVARLLVFCVGAIGAVVQAMDATVPLPITFNIAWFLVIIGFSALFISRNLTRTTPAGRYVRALLHAGQFLAATALFLAITSLFPLYLKLVSWAIYSISILVAYFQYYRFAAKPPL